MIDSRKNIEDILLAKETIMKKLDIRWQQRLSNYSKALDKLTVAIEYIKNNSNKNSQFPDDKIFEDILKEGVIQRFEYTHELAWNVMKDFLENKGGIKLYGSRDATREAFQAELILDGDLWMDMIKSRNKTSHTYNEETAQEIYKKILKNYYQAFMDFQKKMNTLK